MPLGILNFTSAFILLAGGMLLGGLLLLLEHIYFKFFRAKLRKWDKCGCCGLVSLVSTVQDDRQICNGKSLDLLLKHRPIQRFQFFHPIHGGKWITANCHVFKIIKIPFKKFSPFIFRIHFSPMSLNLVMILPKLAI